MEQINREAPIRDLRCVGFHLNSITPDQIRRIRELGIVVSLTPSFI
jgi:predicted amidohydrolase YtcJ